MSEQAERIFEQALSLPSPERASLAERLLESLTADTDPHIDSLWAAEVESRIAAYRRGEISTIPVEDVFDEMDSEAS